MTKNEYSTVSMGGIGSGRKRCRKHPNSERTPDDKRGYSRCKACRDAGVRDYHQTPRGRWSHFKSTAKQRGIPVTLTFEQFKALADRTCAYAIQPEKDIRIGIDQRVAGAGYTPENSVPCCNRHNRFKSDILTYDETMDAVHRYNVRCGNKGTK